MGESSACLIRSFSHDYDHENPLRALTTSISFGRFMTETLDWEKRSAFTQNRNLEEVQKLSKLGTVAQKKAYFEAHYKRIAAKKKEAAAAAALLEQGLQPPNHSPQPSTSSDSSLDSTQNSPAAIDDMEEQQTDLLPSITANEDNPNVEVNNSDYIQVELLNRAENTKMPEEEKTPIKVEDVSNKGDLSSSSKKKKPVVSSLKPSAVKPTNVYLKKNDDNARDLLEKKKKKKSTPKSLHMSMNLGSRAAGETIKTSSPILNKIANSRIVKTLVNASKDSWMQRTPTRASVTGVPKYTYAKPQPENTRTEALLHRPVSRTKAAEGKPPSLPKERSESSRVFCATKTRSPTVSSSFSFKSEERAAKRKEFFRKLEENAKEAEKARPPIKPKIPLTRPCSPKLGRKANVQGTTSRPPWKCSVKNDGSTEMNKRITPSLNNTLLHKRNTRENTSPNIPL